jgi:hypothetical protein
MRFSKLRPKSEGRPRFRRRPSYLDGGKPNSVVDDHLSKRHTRGLNRTGCPPSVLSCTAWGFSCRANCSARGELLPRLFTLACLREEQLFLSKNRRCLFCDTFRQRPLSRTPPAYSTRHAAVWCSDFPPANLAIHQRSSTIDAYSSTFRSHRIRS